jgi:hypothetical protein
MDLCCAGLLVPTLNVHSNLINVLAAASGSSAFSLGDEVWGPERTKQLARPTLPS